jgi:hypothetical protein
MAANDDKLCTLLDACGTPEAPLCPLQEITLKKGIWYPDEPVCSSEMFQNLGWLKKQQLIAAMKLKADDGFFTVRMLNALKTIPQKIKGADPDSDDPEEEWLKSRERPERKQAANKKASSQKTENKAVMKPAKNFAKVPRRERLF